MASGGGKRLGSAAADSVPDCRSVPDSYDSRTHAPNENVRLEDVGPAVRLMHALLEGLGDEGWPADPKTP